VKKGIDNRKKNTIAAVLGGLALIAVFVLYNELFGGPSAPPPAPAIPLQQRTLPPEPRSVGAVVEP